MDLMENFVKMKFPSVEELLLDPQVGYYNKLASIICTSLKYYLYIRNLNPNHAKIFSHLIHAGGGGVVRHRQKKKFLVHPTQ